MLYSELEDCDDCPLLKERICPGGMTCGPNGPIEPPCCSFDKDEDLDAWVSSYWSYLAAREAREDARRKQEQEKRKKKEITAAKQRFTRFYTRKERHEVDRLKKAIKAQERALSFASSLAFAFNMTNEMFGYKERAEKNQEADKELLELKQKLETAKLALKEKQKECRKTKEYQSIGKE